jgi:hypothetical protein
MKCKAKQAKKFNSENNSEYEQVKLRLLTIRRYTVMFKPLR